MLCLVVAQRGSACGDRAREDDKVADGHYHRDGMERRPGRRVRPERGGEAAAASEHGPSRRRKEQRRRDEAQAGDPREPGDAVSGAEAVAEPRPFRREVYEQVTDGEGGADGQCRWRSESVAHEHESDHADLQDHPEGADDEDVGGDGIAAAPQVVAVMDEDSGGEAGRSNTEPGLGAVYRRHYEERFTRTVKSWQSRRVRPGVLPVREPP